MSKTAPQDKSAVILSDTEYADIASAMQGIAEELQATLQAIPDLLFELDEDGRFLKAWAHDKSQLFATEDVFIGKKASEILPPDVAAQIASALKEAGKSGYSQGQVLRLGLAQGARWFELSTALKRGPGGSKRFIVLSRDISERKKAEVALRETEMRLRFMLESSPIAVRLARAGGHSVIFANQRYHELVNTSHAVGKNPQSYYANPEDYEAVLQELGKGKRVVNKLMQLVIPQQGTKWVYASYLSITYEGEAAVLGWFYDVTELKRTEMSLQEAYAQLANEKQRFETLMHTSGDGIHIFDADGRLVEVNERFCEMLGYTRDEILRMSVRDWDANFSPEELKRKIQENLLMPNIFETRHRRKNGEVIEVEISAKAMLLNGSVVVWNASRDITQRKKMEDELRLSASIYQNSSEGMLVADGNNRIVAVNPAFTRLTGYSPEDVIGQTPKLLSSGLQTPEFYREMWSSIRHHGHWEGEIWNRHKAGHVFAEQLSISVMKNSDGTVHRYIAQFSDVTEKKKKEELIWHHANYDQLSGLPNRRLFLDRLDLELRKAKRDEGKLALLFIDLDRFKEINDTLGHAKGDLLLKQAAERIRKYSRESDTVARLGGDEFTIIVGDITGSAGVERVAQRILQVFEEPFDLGDGDRAFISASVGVAVYPDDAADSATLMKHADQSMYAAKSMGRNQFSYFTPSMQKAAEDKLSLTNDLRDAIANRELELYYQPIIRLADGAVLKAEALLRWKNPKRGMVSPAVFIPVAEDNGLIHEIGEWVFSEAIADAGRWLKRFPGGIEVAVNKSPAQFTRLSGHGWLEKLAASGLPPGCMAVEITESTLLKETAAVRQRLNAFKEHGVRVAIDDFGTGYSALSYLHQYDVDYLKIDRSFISDLITNEKKQSLVEAIIVMAHKLGIKTVAEGVETQAHHDALVKLGCDFAQGYLYSKPVPKSEFEAFMDTIATKGTGVKSAA